MVFIVNLIVEKETYEVSGDFYGANSLWANNMWTLEYHNPFHAEDSSNKLDFFIGTIHSCCKRFGHFDQDAISNVLATRITQKS